MQGDWLSRPISLTQQKLDWGLWVRGIMLSLREKLITDLTDPPQLSPAVPGRQATANHQDPQEERGEKQANEMPN